jgi:hypothetical protein
MARISFHRSPFTPALILALVLLGGVWNWMHPSHPERQERIHGYLEDWSLHKLTRSRGQTVHLRITGRPEEFRIDPAIFRDLMGNRLPTGFIKGAAIDVTADAAQLAAPLRPLLGPDVAVVWVNGLIVNGATVLAPNDVLRHEGGQWSAWYLLAAMATAYLGFTIIMNKQTVGLGRG